MRIERTIIRLRRAALVLLAAVPALLIPQLAARAVSWDTPEASRESAARAEELDALVGPIALYPDDLLALVLPASTYPIQVVLASRLLADQEQDEELRPDPDWDGSLIALLNYPEALALLNEDLDWTWRLGDAVLEDQGAVMDAIQRFRSRVYAAGNLESNEKYVVTHDDGTIVVESADPEVIYVPGYRASSVVIVHTGAPLFWYSDPYPYYYHPRAAYWSGFYFGGWYGLSWGGHGSSHYRHHVTVHKDVHVHGKHSREHHSQSGEPWHRGEYRMSGDRPDGRDRGRGTSRRAEGRREVGLTRTGGDSRGTGRQRETANREGGRRQQAREHARAWEGKSGAHGAAERIERIERATTREPQTYPHRSARRKGPPRPGSL